MIDDQVAALCQAMDIGFASPEIAAFDRIVKQAIDAVAVVGIVFCGIDAALGGNTMGTSGTVLKTERLDVVTQLGHGGGRCAAAKSGADDDDIKFAFVGGIDQFQFKPMPLPFFRYGPCGYFSV
jgi:hypothetical protein